MSKKIKMVIYGEPGVGKSVFALGAPKPFFITTDGNYEWLEEFGAKPEDHVQVSSWSQMKKEMAKPYDDYDTIVIDLLEDAFKWCEQEYCIRERISHVSDLGYGKGYDSSRNEFFIDISKLIAKDKHIILIMHGMTTSIKDRRGIEHIKYIPSTRLPDKVIVMIEGRVRYFLRAYLQSEEKDGKLIKKRYLSLVPKENEYGIIRGVDENKPPQDIELDFKAFTEALNIEDIYKDSKVKKQRKQITVEEIVEKPIKSNVAESISKEESDNTKVSQSVEEIKIESPTQVIQNEEANQTAVEEIDKIAAIKARLAKMKSNQ